ncbi:unnamed protein product, partial [Vitis vinifera]
MAYVTHALSTLQLGSPEFPATWRRGRIGRAALLHCGELRVAVRFTLTWLFSFIFIPGLTSGSFSFSFSNVFAPSSTWDVRDAYEVNYVIAVGFVHVHKERKRKDLICSVWK